MTEEFKDWSFEEAVAAAEVVIATGGTVYQKFTCIGCGNRLTIETPNTFHQSGTCNACPAVTDIQKNGCNFMAIFHSTRMKP
jgi:hypothetical protein